MTDSIDGLRDRSSVGLRGGNAGRLSANSERAGGGGGGGRSFRVGSAGGTFGLGFSSGRGDGVGGGRTAGRCVRASEGLFLYESPSKADSLSSYDGGGLGGWPRSAAGRNNGGSGPDG